MLKAKSSATSGFHLFLEPEGVIKKSFSEIIKNLALEYGGPVFEPHVTLLARIPTAPSEEILKKVQSLAGRLSPFSLTLGMLASENKYFKALYVQIEENDALTEAYIQALELFSMPEEEPYLPHLSLLYGNYSEEQKMKSYSSLILPQENSFHVRHISLYKTEGAVDQWELIQHVSLST